MWFCNKLSAYITSKFKTYLRPFQISMMKLFAKIVKSSNIFARNSVMDIGQGRKYASASNSVPDEGCQNPNLISIFLLTELLWHTAFKLSHST